jgi:hypothetical protein
VRGSVAGSVSKVDIVGAFLEDVVKHIILIILACGQEQLVYKEIRIFASLAVRLNTTCSSPHTICGTFV